MRELTELPLSFRLKRKYQLKNAMQFTRRLVNNDLFSFSICWLLAPNCLVCLTTRRYNDTYLRAHHHSNLIKFDYDEALLCKYRNWHANRNKDNNDYFVAIFLSSINLRFIGDARSVLIPAFVKWYSKVNLVHMNYKSQLNYHCAFDVTNSQYTAWRTFSKVDIHLMSACARASNRISILFNVASRGENYKARLLCMCTLIQYSNHDEIHDLFWAFYRTLSLITIVIAEIKPNLQRCNWSVNAAHCIFKWFSLSFISRHSWVHGVNWYWVICVGRQKIEIHF